jgi:hypothetical protein
MEVNKDAYWKAYEAYIMERFTGQSHLAAFILEMQTAFYWSSEATDMVALRVGPSGVCLMFDATSQQCSFGFMMLSADGVSDQQLWEEALTFAKERGSIQLKGPIQGTTYFPYRFVMETDESSFFKGEYFSAPTDHAFMMEQSPDEVQYYRSGYRDYFDGIMKVSEPYYDQALGEGVVIKLHRSVDRDLFHSLAHLIDQIFGGNWSFQKLSPAALEQMFQQEFGTEQKMALHTFWYQGQMIGFCRYIQNDEDTIICKTLGLLSEYQKRGWGNASVYQMHADAKENEVRRMIYALIYDGNRVQQNMPKDDSIIFRRYASYSFQLK